MSIDPDESIVSKTTYNESSTSFSSRSSSSSCNVVPYLSPPPSPLKFSRRKSIDFSNDSDNSPIVPSEQLRNTECNEKWKEWRLWRLFNDDYSIIRTAFIAMIALSFIHHYMKPDLMMPDVALTTNLRSNHANTIKVELYKLQMKIQIMGKYFTSNKLKNVPVKSSAKKPVEPSSSVEKAVVGSHMSADDMLSEKEKKLDTRTQTRRGISMNTLLWRSMNSNLFFSTPLIKEEWIGKKLDTRSNLSSYNGGFIEYHQTCTWTADLTKACKYLDLQSVKVQAYPMKPERYIVSNTNARVLYTDPTSQELYSLALQCSQECCDNIGCVAWQYNAKSGCFMNGHGLESASQFDDADCRSFQLAVSGYQLRH